MAVAAALRIDIAMEEDRWREVQIRSLKKKKRQRSEWWWLHTCGTNGNNGESRLRIVAALDFLITNYSFRVLFINFIILLKKYMFFFYCHVALYQVSLKALLV